MFLSEKHSADLGAALRQLGEFAAQLRWEDVPTAVADRLLLVLLDTVGVTVAGGRTPEVAALIAAWDPPRGPARLAGGVRSAPVDAAAWLNGTAACCLELDEGNKFARGHPAAHAFPAAIALAEARGVSGAELCAALLVGHEVAARFGRATIPAAGLHPHGHWGAAGAAAAAGRLLGLTGSGIAAAIDAVCGLPLATHFDSALRGTFVRNTWVGAANANGLVAARLAAATLATVDSTAELTLGRLLGSFDQTQLTAELGLRYDVLHGYFKRHASCSYTHPPADAVLELRRNHPGLSAEDVTQITVETHRLAVPLARKEFPTRLAAMFSIPYVVAVAFVEGACPPSAFDDVHRADPLVHRLAEAVTVRLDGDLDARLPAERSARVTIRLRDGRLLTAGIPNPIGDADYHPFGRADISRKLETLIGAEDAGELVEVVDALPAADNAAGLLARVP
jgi:2-methylcitrate dehydratase PrpD